MITKSMLVAHSGPATMDALIVEMEPLGGLSWAVMAGGPPPWRGPRYGGSEGARWSRGRPLVGRVLAGGAIS